MNIKKTKQLIQELEEIEDKLEILKIKNYYISIRIIQEKDVSGNVDKVILDYEDFKELNKMIKISVENYLKNRLYYIKKKLK